MSILQNVHITKRPGHKTSSFCKLKNFKKTFSQNMSEKYTSVSIPYLRKYYTCTVRNKNPLLALLKRTVFMKIILHAKCHTAENLVLYISFNPLWMSSNIYRTGYKRRIDKHEMNSLVKWDIFMSSLVCP